MGLINTDGLTIVGSGSEWFWTMAQFVVVSVTLVALFRQVRLQSGVTEIQLIKDIYRSSTSTPLPQARLEILEELAQGTERSALPYGVIGTIGDWWEELAGWVRDGHLPATIIYRDFDPSVRFWWFVCEPWVRRQRALEERDNIWNNWEWLVARMERMDRRAGIKPKMFDDELLARTLADRIERARIEVLEVATAA